MTVYLEQEIGVVSGQNFLSGSAIAVALLVERIDGGSPPLSDLLLGPRHRIADAALFEFGGARRDLAVDVRHRLPPPFAPDDRCLPLPLLARIIEMRERGRLL